MILYCILTNAGGMKRIHQHLTQQKNIIIALLSDKRVKQVPNTYWIHYPVLKIEDHAKSSVEPQLNKLRKIISEHKITGVICDYPSAIFLQHLKIPYILDVHTLARPLYSSIIESPKRLALNATLNYPQIAAIEMLMYPYLKQENSIVLQASAFISNSRNTTKSLKELYGVKNKIFELPVTTEFQKSPIKKERIRKVSPYGLVFGRWHPQKGLENILLNDWRPLKILIRGLDSNIFKGQALNQIKSRGIYIKKWTNSDAVLSRELMQADFVLFPSLYEPYGLALHEALALGCLCIAHKNHSGHEDQIKHGHNGFLLDMHKADVVDDVKKILTLSTKKLTKIKEAARKNNSLNHKSRDKKFGQMLDWADREFARQKRLAQTPGRVDEGQINIV